MRPFRNMMWPDKAYRSLDPGIRFAVRVLHANGFETGQSCQGGDGHAYHEPTIEWPALGDDAGFGALDALQSYGLPVNSVSIVWLIRNGVPFEKNWRVTFRQTMEDRANDRPSFVFSYRAAL